MSKIKIPLYIFTMLLPLSLCAQSAEALLFFNANFPQPVGEMESMAGVFQKNNVKTLKANYIFNKTEDEKAIPPLLYQNYSINAQGKTIENTLIMIKLPKDTLNKATQSTVYDSLNRKISFKYNDRRGDEINRTETWKYNENSQLTMYSNSNELTTGINFYYYNDKKQLDSLKKTSFNLEFETKKQFLQQFSWKNDTLWIENNDFKPKNDTTERNFDFFYKKDSIIYSYNKKINAQGIISEQLLEKYWLNSQNNVLQYAEYDGNAYLPKRTIKYTYYPNKKLKGIYELRGAGNLQIVKLYLPTGEILSIEYLSEKTKREYHYNPQTGLPDHVDMFQKGAKRGTIRFVF